MANIIPIDFDSYLGLSYAPDIETSSGGIVTDPALINRVVSAGNRMVSRTENPKLPYTFKVLNTDQINAFALPGGPVYVNKGLLDIVDDNELAAVMGHEIGHINARHSVNSMEVGLGLGAVSNLVQSYLKKDKKLGLSESDLNNINKFNLAMNNFISLGYSRENEYEADAKGLSYLNDAGYNPYGMVSLMQKFQALQGRNPSKYEVFFSTHPATSDRIDKIEGIIKKNYPNAKAIVVMPPTMDMPKSTWTETIKKPAVKYTLIGGTILIGGFLLYKIIQKRKQSKYLSAALKKHELKNPEPVFHSRKEAVEYGMSIANDADKINELRQARWVVLSNIRKIKKSADPDFQEWSELAAQSNFYKEALEAAEIKKNPIRPIAPTIYPEDGEKYAIKVSAIYNELRRASPEFSAKPEFTITKDKKLKWVASGVEYNLEPGIFGMLESIITDLKAGTVIRLTPEGDIKVVGGKDLFTAPIAESDLLPKSVPTEYGEKFFYGTSPFGDFWSNTKIIEFVKAVKYKDKYGTTEFKKWDFPRKVIPIINKARFSPLEYKLLARTLDSPPDVIGLPDSRGKLITIKDKYFDYFRKRYPGAYFYTTEWTNQPMIVVKEGGIPRGVIMPLDAPDYVIVGSRKFGPARLVTKEAKKADVRESRIPHKPYSIKVGENKYDVYIWHPGQKKSVVYQSVTGNQADNLIDKFTVAEKPVESKQVKPVPAKAAIPRPIPKSIRKYARFYLNKDMTFSKNKWRIGEYILPVAITRMLGTPGEWDQRVKYWKKQIA